MQIASPTITWLVCSFGIVLATGGAYVLGRIDAKRREINVSHSWVTVVDHGVFGLELESRFRSRANAENRRRYLVGLGEKAGAITYQQWLKVMTEKVHSTVYWDRVMHIEEAFDDMNAEIAKLRGEQNVAAEETVVLPAIVEVKPVDEDVDINSRLDEVAAGIGAVNARLNHTDELISSMLRQMDSFRRHVEDLDRKMEAHNSRAGHVTAEMDLIRETERPIRPDFNDAQRASGPARRSDGPARTLVSLPGVAEHWTYHEHRPEAVESIDKADEDGG
jgi:hypothetical protein